MPYYYYGGYFDPTYLLLIIGTILSLLASAKVKSAYNKYSQISLTYGMTGEEVAQRILRNHGVYDVQVQQVAGTMTDHYDPTKQVVNLSTGVFRGTSIAAAAIAAHECGHVLQHQEGYGPLKLRSMLVPAANFGSRMSWIFIMIGLLIGAGASNVIVQLGIILFSLSVLFYLVTLPVEFNASSRAMKILVQFGVLTGEEEKGVDKVLTAAALTYVASAAAMILQLLRLILLFGGRDHD